MSSSYTKTRIMVECALMIALGTILANIKIYELPNGGSITLFSMVPFILVSFRHGVKWGLFTGFVNSLLQMLLGFYAPPAPGLLPLVGMILLDYVLAFSFLGLACVFAKPFKNKLVGVAVGSAAVCVLRFLCSFLSGVLIWGNLTDGLPTTDFAIFNSVCLGCRFYGVPGFFISFFLDLPVPAAQKFYHGRHHIFRPAPHVFCPAPAAARFSC